jgi:hypothetical protein
MLSAGWGTLSVARPGRICHALGEHSAVRLSPFLSRCLYTGIWLETELAKKLAVSN